VKRPSCHSDPAHSLPGGTGLRPVTSWTPARPFGSAPGRRRCHWSWNGRGRNLHLQ